MPAAARLKTLPRALALTGALVLLAGCGGSGGGTAGHPATVTVTASTSGHASASSSAAAAASGKAHGPAIVAVTAHGALVVLNPATGSVTKTLVASGVTGDEVAVTGGGLVFYTARHGCADTIESVSVHGGTPALITAGSLPAVSPSGARLAYASEPSLTVGCVPSAANLTPLYKLIVRDIATGAQTVYPMVPAHQQDALPAPISHLSWAADNRHLAVSIASIQDNEGWNLALVDTAAARYYLSGRGISFVAPTGSPTPRRSYLREGIYLPDGSLFVSRACCAGFPVHNTSRLMWEVSTSGALVHQVAVGYPSLEHTSLAASPDGRWLLYLAGQSLYVSRGGATPRELTSGYVAATWS
jgi:hypothetical protein